MQTTYTMKFCRQSQRSRMIGWLLLSAVFSLTIGTVRGQVLYGSLTGNITDPSGAAVPTAKVEAVNLGDLRLDATLKVSQISESVTVSAAAVILQMDTADIKNHHRKVRKIGRLYPKRGAGLFVCWRVRKTGEV